MAEEPTDDAGRDWTRIVFILGCVFAATAVALLVPSLASDGIRGSPIDSVLPGEQLATTNAGSSFGALNPQSSTGVGGATGFDKATFGNNNTEVHFTVESPRPTYWRTGTYETYTGSGWKRDIQTKPYNGQLNTDLPGKRIVYEVELKKPASALPTAWRPQSVGGVEGVKVTENDAFLAKRTLRKGTTFSGVSRVPPRDVDALRKAGTEYPKQIRKRYTQLPADTPDRIGRLTRRLTEDEKTAYDKAKAVQNWLRENKEYSLEVSKRGKHLTDTFLFEMEKGYCEYFATSMATMLRTQGIPARYTIGYTTGQKIDENLYQVRGMNAHAWVEVYFPDIGWVRFDPTPGGSRLQAQRSVLQREEPDLDYNLTESGSPGEMFSPGEIRNTTTPSSDNDDTQDKNGYTISLNRTAVPGLPVEVTVQRNGESVSEIRVRFNGESVGYTDEDGTLVATVPATKKLEITVEPTAPGTDDISIEPANVSESHLSPSGLGAFSGPNRVGSPASVDLHAYLAVTPTDSHTSGVQEESTNDSKVVDVVTNASISVTGDPYPGTPIQISATAGGVELPSATVFLDGRRVGTTNRTGETTVRLPEDARNVTIAVERGPVYGQTTVSVTAVSLDVDTGLIALPLGGGTVKLTAGGEGISGVPIRQDDRVITETDTNGEAQIRMPLAPKTTITASPGGLSRTETVGGLFRNLAVVLASGVLAVGLPLVVIYRRGHTVRGVVRALTETVSRALSLLVSWIEWARRAITARLSKTLVYLARLAAGTQTPSQLAGKLRGWLTEKLASVRSRLPEEILSRGGSTQKATTPEEIPTLREAWNRFLTVIEVEQPETRTPGELATTAIEDQQLPARPVRTLRDAFREVEYGNRSAEERTERVMTAIARIERAARAPEPENDGIGSSLDGESQHSSEETITGFVERSPRSEPPTGGDR